MYMKKSEYQQLKNAFKAKLHTVVTKDARRGFDPDPGNDADAPFSITKYLRGVTFGNWGGASIEKRAHEFAKALGTDSEAAGGALIPTELDAMVIPRLAGVSVVRRMPGVRVVAMGARLSRDYSGVDSGATISWGQQGGTISEDTSMDFRRSRMELKKAVCLLNVSRELIENPGADGDAVVRDELVRALGEAESAVLLRGLGGTQPLGIYSQPRISSTDLSGEIDQDDITTAELQLANSNAQCTGFISNPTTKDRIRKLKDANGRYLIEDGGFGPTGGIMDAPRLFGRPYLTTTQIPTTGYPDTNESFLVGGMWSDFLLGDGDIRIESSIHDQWTTDLVSIRLVKRLGYLLMHPESFVVVRGIANS